MLDKFIGDGVMALFGVLNHKNDEGKADVIAACKAAISLCAAFDTLSQKWLKEWKLYTPQAIEVGLGCGTHTGEVLVGNVGTSFRDQFTALGPHVNFAARIESRSKSGQILVSQSTEARVSEVIKMSPNGQIDDIKNVPGSFQIFEVFAEQ